MNRKGAQQVPLPKVVYLAALGVGCLLIEDLLQEGSQHKRHQLTEHSEELLSMFFNSLGSYF